MLESEAMNGQGLVDSQFFYEVEDNCAGGIVADIVVKTNEIQKDSIAELFEYEVNGAQQAMVLYAATS